MCPNQADVDGRLHRYKTKMKSISGVKINGNISVEFTFTNKDLVLVWTRAVLFVKVGKQ